ncbi:holliday junction ATP-dependent DNA helicase RuvA [Collinsella sp. CAG:289]|nr:holliday junction ATP-dependent DNA helicase RuvA [Collinsella sp. CAG:289]
MISLIRGTLVEATAQYAIIDAAGVGFELGISSMTAAALPALGTEYSAAAGIGY